MSRSNVVPCLEFKAQDGAWYEVSLKLQHHKLIIHYEADLPQVRDEELSLENVKDLQELKTKFRLPSRQLMDKECKKVTPGMVVCAFHSDMDKRTFDARVEKVSWSKHYFVDGEEQCNCTYEVIWLAGPYEREKTTIHCENIFLLQFKSIQSHPLIKEVLEYLQSQKDCISQFAVESSSRKKIEKIRDNNHRPLNPRVIDLPTENLEIMNRGDRWPVRDGALTDIEGELRGNVEESFNYKPNMKNNILQQPFSDDNKPGILVQSVIDSIPEKKVLDGADTDNNLHSPKQENRDTITAACKSEGYGSERDTLAQTYFGVEDAKDECHLKFCSGFFVDGFSGGWIDDESPRSGKDCGGNIVGQSDNDFAYFSMIGDANHMNGHKELRQDCSPRLDNSNRSSSLVIIDDEDGDMQSNDNAIEHLSSRREGENWDVAKNEGIMNACSVYSQGRSREPKISNNPSDNHIRNCGKNIECKQPLDGLKTPHLTPNKRKDLLSSDSCDCKDVTYNRGEEAGIVVHVCTPDSMWDHQGKRPRCGESQLVKALVEENIFCEKKQGDPVGNNSEMNKQNSHVIRSGKFDRNTAFKLFGAPIEADNVIVDMKVLESTPKSCCGCREDCSENQPLKHIATEDIPLMQCQDAHHSVLGLHDFSTNIQHNGEICHCHFCNRHCPCFTHFHLYHEYCAECGSCICSLVGQAHYCYIKAMCTECFSVHKEIAASSSDCIGNGNDCLVSLKDELTDYKEQSELSHTGNLNVTTHQRLESSQKVNLGGMAVISNEAKCNSLEQAAGQTSMDGRFGPGREEESKDQHKLFPSSHVILLENLEKDVTPSDVLGVIRQAGVDFVKVYISPPQSFQKFTRGIVCFEDQESFQRASSFVRNENIIIASLKGRPWVVIDMEDGLSEGSFGGFTTGPKCCGSSSSNKIHILKIGTPEYEKAEKLRSKFLEWWEDLKLLHKGLAYDETAV